MPIKCLPKNNTNPLDYFRERGGFVVENESGWANYYIIGTSAYLENLYVYPEKRKGQFGPSLLSVVEMELKEIRKVEVLITTISRSIGAENLDKTLLLCLRRGFKFHASDLNAIILKKEL